MCVCVYREDRPTHRDQLSLLESSDPCEQNNAGHSHTDMIIDQQRSSDTTTDIYRDCHGFGILWMFLIAQSTNPNPGHYVLRSHRPFMFVADQSFVFSIDFLRVQQYTVHCVVQFF